MKMTLRRKWTLCNIINKPEIIAISIPSGTYEIEEIPNPFGFEGNWLIIKGTQIGAPEMAIVKWAQKVFPKYQRDEEIIINI